MNIKIKLFILGWLCLSITLKAQPVPVQAIQIGEAIPEAIWKLPLAVVNHPEGKDSIKLNEYRGKLIILDFWSSWCGSCLAAFPKTDSLQSQFSGRVQFLKVTFEEPAKVKNGIYSVVADKALWAIFPHRILPHYVWISPEGRFLTTSDSQLINSGSITTALQQKAPTFQPKIDLDSSKPLFLSGVTTDSVLSYSLLIKGAAAGYASETLFRKTNGVLRGRAMTNRPVFDLYQAALIPLFKGKGEVFNWKRCRFDVADTTHIFYRDNLASPYLYSFDFIQPPNQADSLYLRLLAMLNQSLPYFGRMEKQQIPCLVLMQTKRSASQHTPSGTSITALVSQLNSLEALTSLPIVDESGYTGKITVPLTGLSLSKLKQSLSYYGLELTQTERSLYVFTLTDKK
ncbi:Thioredoxin [bacterium A37T11]|nr:Thioredoxin [bacterium A37T11]